MKVASFEPRAVCERCRRPVGVCVCAHLPELAPSARVVILQHPRERRMPIGTAHMASRCLKGSAVVVGTHLEAHPTVVRALADPDRQPVLLWPGPGAKDLATSPPTGPITLFVVDGTWSTAKKLLKLNPSIARLARYAIAPKGPSEYRIRREPRAECLSTIEAISSALGVLEGDPEPYRAMMTPFRAMIDAQLVFLEKGGHPRDRSRLMRKARARVGAAAGRCATRRGSSSSRPRPTRGRSTRRTPIPTRSSTGSRSGATRASASSGSSGRRTRSRPRSPPTRGSRAT